MQAHRAEGIEAGAEDAEIGADAGFLRGDRGDDLEGGAWRVAVRNGLVGQRPEHVGVERAPFIAGNAAIERGRIESRRRRHRQNFAGEDIHHHGRAGLLGGDALLGEFLQADVDRGDQIGAGLALFARQLADDASDRVDLDLALAGRHRAVTCHRSRSSPLRPMRKPGKVSSGSGSAATSGSEAVCT